ncbi:uncharacterized protein LOC132629234 [Lycium barbarum]|uniref:uncharacterized protein LOC132629234 n=1 Tax=Lycium barbarum TaxID=112863 RepID=UPI00293F1125|nr:uncharacterized protein LOC132629234 [Lycium barbarum]
MEGCSENLDDGELWLPSDIFPVEEIVSVSVPHNNKFKNNSPTTSSFCCCDSCLHHHNDHLSLKAAVTDENIIQRFAAISLLQQRPLNIHSVPNSFPITERFRPADRYSCKDYSLTECFETGPQLVYQPVQLYPPVQLKHQVESLMEARSRVLHVQAEKNRFIRMHNMKRNPGLDRFSGNRFLPFGGSANGGSSSGRDYGGTGVFLPRVSTNNIDNNVGKRQGGRNRQDVQQTGQRYPCI